MQKALPTSALSQNTLLLGRPTVLGRAGCRCTSPPLEMGMGQGPVARGQGPMYPSYLGTLSSAPRVCCELGAPKGRGRRTHVAGFRHTSSFGGLCSRALSYLVSRLPPAVSSGLSFRSFGFFNQCVRTPTRAHRVRTHAIPAQHRTDSLILLAGMRPSWGRQPTWALTCPGSPTPTTCTTPCAQSARTILISRDPSQCPLSTRVFSWCS